jgi:hypothetical protein
MIDNSVARKTKPTSAALSCSDSASVEGSEWKALRGRKQGATAFASGTLRRGDGRRNDEGRRSEGD